MHKVMKDKRACSVALRNETITLCNKSCYCIFSILRNNTYRTFQSATCVVTNASAYFNKMCDYLSNREIAVPKV